MRITADLLDAYLRCPAKCWLTAHGEEAADAACAQWLDTRNERYKRAGITRLFPPARLEDSVISPVPEVLRNGNWRVATDVLVRGQLLESHVHTVECTVAPGQRKSLEFAPVRFAFSNKPDRSAKLLLAFDALALSEMLEKSVTRGRLIQGDDYKSVRVNLRPLADEVRQHVGKITALLTAASAPELVLNRHCAECQFTARCRQKALDTDDLSLLSGMTEKERNKLRKRGIFTVTQLSYTFRPRRRRKGPSSKPEKYQHSLRALAIRENRIYVVGNPELKIAGTPVYLDVEGVPDRSFYYLIGLRLGDGPSATRYSLWADERADEERIWSDFLGILESIDNPLLIHYGSYETKFLKQMCARYGAPPAGSIVGKAVRQPINLLSVIFAQVYFPTFSNSLKEVAQFLGAKWEGIVRSGWQSLACRLDWEQSRNPQLKAALETYNQEDCAALATVAFHLNEITRNATSRTDVGCAHGSQKAATETGAEVHRSFQSILSSAHFKYAHSRIKLSPAEGHAARSDRPPAKRQRRRSFSAIKGKTVRVPRKRVCPRCPGHKLGRSSRTAEHSLVDLVFSKAGCHKTIIRYSGQMGYCRLCGQVYAPPTIRALRNQQFGWNFQAWVVYQRLALRMSYRLISKATFELFSEPLPLQTATAFVERCSEEYRRTEALLLRRILDGPVVHVDETKMNILGTDQYVWVLTDNARVVFQLRPNRETGFLKSLLANFKGTLVSDFYGGYDALPCRQQKCLVHLIRDLNDDLWKNPFDEEFEKFVVAVRDLLCPILEDTRRFGFKVRHLGKHRDRVQRFYKEVIGRLSEGETTTRYRKRFERYRESMFAFLEADGIPWHNNAAERALRHLAVQRKISGAFGEKGAVDYLRLLAVAQTCRFQQKSFLGFLLSKCTDVDQYRERQRVYPDWAVDR